MHAALVATSMLQCEDQFLEGPPAVNVAQVVTETISEWDPYDGRITAIDSVEIRPRVTGYLAATHFREGGRVAKGALLFTVDDREYQAALASARANTARAVTRADVARLEAARSEKLKAARAISEEELESRRGELRQAEADVAAAQAQERQAALNVEFTQIRSPIAGLVSSARVRPGNLVSAGSTLLTTVVSTDPVYVEFEGDERMYLKYQDLAKAASARARAMRATPCASVSRTRTAIRTRARWCSSTTCSIPPPGRSVSGRSCRTRTARSRPACSRACSCSAAASARRC
jgi:RND family efflux transporter MFP subunit